MKSTVAVAAIGFALGATIVSGVAVAATSTSSAVKACASNTHVLRLAATSGKCPHGTKQVQISQRGPAGPKGKTGAHGERGLMGKQGIQGKVGQAGPGAVQILLPDGPNTSTTDTAFVDVPNTDLAIRLECASGFATDLQISGTDEYEVDGSAVANLTAASTQVTATPTTGNHQHPPLSTPGVVHYVNDDSTAADVSSIAVLVNGGGAPTNSGQLNLTLEITDGSTTADVQAYLQVTQTDCSGVATMTPTTA